MSRGDQIDRPGSVVLDLLSKRFKYSPLSRLAREDGTEATDLAAIDGDVEDEDGVEEIPLEEEARPRGDGKSVWALRDISLNIEPGTALGIIGRNGAGKTTLLRILGGTVPPTSGSARIVGQRAPLVRTAARLLEGSLTGRQNVYLACDLFDVSTQIAELSVDRIFAFADAQDLIDVEYRRYSTGYQQRLATSIMLNLKPDVLLADELPNMGDAEFRVRCRSRLEEMIAEDVTLILASHDLDLVRELCSRAVRLEEGRIIQIGDPGEVVDSYVAETGAVSRQDRFDRRIAKLERVAHKSQKRAARSERRANKLGRVAARKERAAEKFAQRSKKSKAAPAGTEAGESAEYRSGNPARADEPIDSR